MSATLLLAAMGGVVRRDAQLFWSYRLRAVSRVLGVFFSLTMFYYVSRLVNVSAFPTPDAYFAFAAVGLLVLTVLTASLTALPFNVRQELVAGTFERFAVSPTGPTAGIASMLVFPMTFAVAVASVQLVLASLVFGLDIEWSTAPLAVPVALLGALSFAPFALLMAAAVMVVKQVSGGVGFITTGFAFVGGFFFPVALLPDWLEWFSEVQPFTPALDLLRHLLVGTELAEPALESVLRIGLNAILLGPLSVYVLHRAVGVARARGTLTEY